MAIGDDIKLDTGALWVTVRLLCLRCSCANCRKTPPSSSGTEVADLDLWFWIWKERGPHGRSRTLPTAVQSRAMSGTPGSMKEEAFLDSFILSSPKSRSSWVMGRNRSSSTGLSAGVRGQPPGQPAALLCSSVQWYTECEQKCI